MRYLNLRTITATLVVALFIVAVGCNNNKGRGNSTTANMGVLPTINCLLSPNNAQGFCNYPYGNYYGFSNYDYTLTINGLHNNYSSGFCGCGQQGSFPVYNNNWGLGCLNNSSSFYANGRPVNYLMFTWNAQSRQWTSYNPYQNYNYNYGYGVGATCNTYSVILSCDTGQPGSCGPNGSCIALNNGGTGTGGTYSQSGPGLCVMNQVPVNIGNGGYQQY